MMSLTFPFLAIVYNKKVFALPTCSLSMIFQMIFASNPATKTTESLHRVVLKVNELGRTFLSAKV